MKLLNGCKLENYIKEMYTKPQHGELDWTPTGKSLLDPVYKDELALRLESYNSKMRNSLTHHVSSPTSNFRNDIPVPVGHTETLPR